MTKPASGGLLAARSLRRLAAALVLAASAFAFLDAGEAATRAAAALSSWQLFPALSRAVGGALEGFGLGGLAAAAAAAAILLGTGLFGRWYCAALCPLGTLQDLASLLGERRRSYRKPATPLRAAAFAAFIALALLGASSLASWAEPWSLFSRFMAYGLRNLVRLARREDIPGPNLPAAAASGAALLAVLAASFLSGRWFCGRICPVGSALGLLNAAAPLRLRLERGACVSCGACAAVCRASCIDHSRKRLDSTRCVYCLACLPACPAGALRYGKRRRPGAAPAAQEAQAGEAASLMSRARFLSSLRERAEAVSLLLLAPGRLFSAGAASPREEGGLPKPVLPPGARSIDRFARTCIACGLCVDRCPSKVLQPALGELGARGFMIPRLDHSQSYCQYDCTACMEVCPSGALEKLDLARKRLAKIGDATLVRTRCVVFTKLTRCGACAEHCPTGAVRMAPGRSGLPEPVFTSAICIGCGACHHACPVRPLRAISVSGLDAQGIAEKPSPSLFERAPGKADPNEAGESPQAGSEEQAFPF